MYQRGTRLRIRAKGEGTVFLREDGRWAWQLRDPRIPNKAHRKSGYAKPNNTKQCAIEERDKFKRSLTEEEHT